MAGKTQEIRHLRIEKLKDNPLNKQIHGDFEPKGKDAWLIEDIRERGVELPVLVRPDGVLHDGHRRKYASQHAGRDTVPAIVTDSDDPNVFMSAQLGRNLSLYAKCVLYRAVIESLVSRGIQSRSENYKDARGDSDLDGLWTQTEEVLGVTRKSLGMGVGLLRQIQEIREDNPSRADKIESVFRSRGLRPARRLLGYEPDSRDSEDETNDCADWADDTEGMLPIKRKPREKKPTATSPIPDDCDADTEAWRQEAAEHLDAVEAILTEQELFAKHAESCVAGLRAVIVECDGE